MHRDRHHSFSDSARKAAFTGALVGVAFGLCGLNAAQGGPVIRLDYNLELDSRSRDTAFIELFDDRPLTRDNFLAYVTGNHYDGTIMHRLARSFVVQGGGFYPVVQEEPFPVNVSLDPNAVVDLDGNLQTSNPTVMNEFTNTPMRSNLRGTLAMAKVGGDPNSATNQWFVNLSNNGGTAPNGLDFQNGGFTVFAQVLGDGMTMFDAMNVLSISNLNPDVNNNGSRDNGPFGQSANDGIPLFQSINDDNEIVNNPVVLEDAQRIDYFGAGTTTNLGGGIAFNTRDAFIDTGAGFIGTGAFTIGTGRTLGIRENFVTGRLINNNGTLAPGLQLGTATIGALNQSATGTLEIQLRETTVNTQYDRLVVTTTAQLGGTLNVSLLDDFDPSPGDMFTVLTANAITGNFSEIELPTLAPGLVWNVNRTNMAVTLSVAAADFNRDGVADAADYSLWRDTFGSTVPGFSGADADGNGLINNLDFNVWKANFGNRRGSELDTEIGMLASAAVPEPSAAVLFGSAALASLVSFYRRGNRGPSASRS